MADYKLLPSGQVQRTADKAIVPTDPKNRDRIAYDAWVAASNTPDAADVTDVVYAQNRARDRIDRKFGATLAANLGTQTEQNLLQAQMMEANALFAGELIAGTNTHLLTEITTWGISGVNSELKAAWWVRDRMVAQNALIKDAMDTKTREVDFIEASSDVSFIDGIASGF